MATASSVQKTIQWRADLILKALAVLCAVAGFIFLVRSLPLEGLLEWLQQKVDELGGWAAIVFVLLFIGLTTILLPGWPLNVAAGALFGPVWGGLLTSIGSTSAAAVSFVIARYLASGWIANKIHHYPRTEAVYKALGKEDSWKIVAAVRLSHSLPFGLQNFLLGVSPVGFVPYLLTTWLITLPGIFVIAYLGFLAGNALGSDSADAPTGPWYWVLRGGGVAVAALAIFYLGRVVFKAVKTHSSDAPEENAHENGNENSHNRDGEKKSWSWLSLAAFLAALLFLGAAVWCYLERERFQDWFS